MSGPTDLFVIKIKSIYNISEVCAKTRTFMMMIKERCYEKTT